MILLNACNNNIMTGKNITPPWVLLQTNFGAPQKFSFEVYSVWFSTLKLLA
jgi:hypothetical protein